MTPDKKTLKIEKCYSRKHWKCIIFNYKIVSEFLLRDWIVFLKELISGGKSRQNLVILFHLGRVYFQYLFLKKLFFKTTLIETCFSKNSNELQYTKTVWPLNLKKLFSTIKNCLHEINPTNNSKIIQIIINYD